MKRMNILSALLGILIIAGISVPFSGCTTGSNIQSENQTARVRRGNLTIDITGAGNLALSRADDLAFDMAGIVEEVLVEEGEVVAEGQELVRLDISEWEKQLKNLEKNLVNARRNLTGKESALVKAVRQITDKEFAVRQAELNVQTSEQSLHDIKEVKDARDAVDKVEYDLKFAQSMLRVPGEDVSYWKERITILEERLAKAQKKLQDTLGGGISSDAALQVRKAQLQVEQSQRQMEADQIAVEDAVTAVKDAELDKEDAELSVIEAQDALEEAKNLSPIIKAPFAGFITKVNVNGGDEVKKGTVAVQIADPAKFKADIVVGEMDIVKVKEGGTATVQMDAIQGIVLPATVTHISPTGSVQQGVVSYGVTIELNTLPSGALAGQNPAPALSGSARTFPAFPPEQRSVPVKPEEAPISGSGGLSASEVQTPLSPVSRIKDGMSVTVSIIVAESQDVLLVPNGAITYTGRTSSVKVVNNGVIEEREIKTGINNWQYTEIIEGLAEGEEVIINTVGTSAAPGQSGGQFQRPPVVIPQSGPPMQGGVRMIR